MVEAAVEELTSRNIHSIHAHGVLGEFNYEIEFSGPDDEGRLRVIYAPNGRGKTNLLRAVSLLLTPSLETLQGLIDLPIKNLVISFTGGGKLQLLREAAFAGPFRVTATSAGDAAAELVDPADLMIDPSDFAGRLYRRVWDERQDFSKYVAQATALTTGAVLIGDDRLATTAEDLREAAQLGGGSGATSRRRVGSVARLLDRVERMLSQSTFAGLARETAESGVYAQITKSTLAGSGQITPAAARASLERQIAELLRAGQPHEQYGLVSLRQVRDISSQIHAARSNSRQLPLLYRILTPYLDSVKDQIEALSPALQLINTYVSGVNGFLDRKALRFSTSRGISLNGQDGAPLPPDALSSGERHLLYLMSHALLSTADRPLVVIDEPELSLGIEWQRKLLPELLSCTAQAGVQFLVASHSLQVMNAVARDDIIQPREDR